MCLYFIDTTPLIVWALISSIVIFKVVLVDGVVDCIIVKDISKTFQYKTIQQHTTAVSKMKLNHSVSNN